MNTSLSRSIGFWLLLVVSLVATAIGGWLIASQIGTMTTTLVDGTATGVEVYVGQSLVVVGAGVLAAGIVGILLTLGLVAARSLVPAPAPAVVEAIDWTVEADETPSPVATTQASDEAAIGVAAVDTAAVDGAPENDTNTTGTTTGDAPAVTR